MYIKESLVKPNSNASYKVDNDDIIWAKFDNTNSVFISDLDLCLCYNVPSGTSRQGMIDRDIFDILTQHIEEIQRQNDNQSPRFIVCGDLNAQMGKLNDYVILDNSRHIEALPNDYVGDNTLPRITSDESVNDNGTLLIDFCIQTGLLRIANGRVGADAREGKCIYVGSRGSILIDYVIVSEDLLSHIQVFIFQTLTFCQTIALLILLFKIAFLKQRRRKKVMFEQNMYGTKVC